MIRVKDLKGKRKHIGKKRNNRSKGLTSEGNKLIKIQKKKVKCIVETEAEYIN